MTYWIEFRPAAFRDLARLDQAVREKIAAKIDSLGQDPRPSGVEKLQGREKRYRVRVAVYRIFYEIEDEISLVLAVRIGHRREVNRLL